MSDTGKVVTLEQAAAQVRAERDAGRVVVLCHGCFDIVHPGHIRHLRDARRFGDRLIVSVTGDGDVNKGDGRPLIPQELRAENLAALEGVDWVVINPWPTAVELLRRVRPDVYVKGREYEDNADVRCRAERQTVEGYGGRMIFTSGDVIFSSTALISAMEDAAAPAHARLRRLLEQHGLVAECVQPLLDGFRDRRIAVLGQTTIETDVLCDRPSVAPESPVMTLRPIEQRRSDGGAAMVARHLAAMGARPILVTALPEGAPGEALRRRLGGANVELQALRPRRPLIERQRFLVGSATMMKLELGEPLTLDAAEQEHVVEVAAGIAAATEGLIICDDGQGLFSAAMLRDLCRAVRPLTGLLVGGASGRRANLASFHEMDLLCVSELELREALHRYDVGLTTAVWSLLGGSRSRAALVGMGDEGLTAFGSRRDAHLDHHDWRTRLDALHVPALCAHPVDRLGCSEALIAAASLALAAGAPLVLAAVVGSVAAAAEGQRLGNAVVGAAELRRGLRRLWDAQLTFAGSVGAHAVMPHASTVVEGAAGAVA